MRSRAFILIFAVACGSFSAASTDPDSGTDAGADATVQDGSSGDDGGDGGLAMSRCTGTQKLFDVFDRQLAAAAHGWQLAPNASIQLLPDAGATPPALFASVPILRNSEKADHTISRGFDLGADGSVCVELDVFLEKVDGAFTNDSFAEIVQFSAVNTPSLFVEFRPEGVAFVQGTDGAVIPEMVPGVWHHLLMRVAYGASEHPVLEVDGNPSVSGNQPAGAKPAGIDVAIGLRADSRTGETGAVRVFIDNFRLTTLP